MWDLGRLGRFSTATAAQKRVSAWLQAQRPGAVDEDDAAWIARLVENHHDQARLAGWTGARVERDPSTRRNFLRLVFADDPGRDGIFSYRKCFAPPSWAEDAKRAMRAEVDAQVRAWKASVGYEGHCALCGARVAGRDAHADHHPVDFARIVREFLTLKKMRIEDVPVERPGASDAGGRLRSRAMAPGGVAEEWRQFHARRAAFRILCCPCNTRQPLSRLPVV